MREQWSSRQAISDAVARFEAMVPGYLPPRAYAVGCFSPHRTTPHVVPFVSDSGRRLPAIVLARVCGHVSGSAHYHLTRDQLATAIDWLAPAQACRDYDHPNLSAWRTIAGLARESSGAEIVAVFVHNATDPVEEVMDRLRSCRRQSSTCRSDP